MSFNTLLKVSSSGKITISEEAYTIPEYKNLISKDKGSKGDHDGRKKERTKKYFLYMYHLIHPASINANILSYSERKKAAIKTSGLEEDFKEHDDLIKAIERYKSDIKLTSIGNAYYAAEKSLFSIAEDIKYYQDQADDLKIMYRTKLAEFKNVIDLENLEPVKVISGLLDNLTKTQGELLKNIERLPKAKAIVDDLAAKFAEEGGGKIKKVGGGQVGNRELPRT